MNTLSRRELLAASVALSPLTATDANSVQSPDGGVEIVLRQDGAGVTTYSVLCNGTTVMSPSSLGFRLDDGSAVRSGWKITRTSRKKVQSSWKPPYGERAVIPENYGELTVDIDAASPALPKLRLVLRAYNEGAAWRFVIPTDQKPITIAAELTQFRFPDGVDGYEEHGTEGEYSRVPVTSIKPDCERPLTVVYPARLFGSLTEAALDNYPRMLLSVVDGVLGSALSGPAAIRGGQELPWRLLVLGTRPGDLLERNYLVLNLNAPSQISDNSWIRPGKVIREVTLSTKGGKACVDFAVQHGLQYVEYDAGWYGHEYDDASDARTISPDPKRIASIPDHGGLNLQEVIDYGQSRGIGVILYVNRRALERQLDEILPLYAKWGVKGVKYGFVNVGPQQWTTWLMDAVRKAAQHKLMVDIHDSYRPTGFSRTYPNLLTQEGIRGNEHMPTARHNCTLPFTRFVAGAGDYTVCYYNDRIKTTHAHQLAISAAFYSPMQFLFWYDRPDAYQGEPEVEFFRNLPVVWDDTRVLDGAIGEHVTIARRKGAHWYIGSLTNENARSLEMPLSFLESRRKYTAHIYQDDDSAPTRTKVRILRVPVNRGTVLAARLLQNGGQAIRITPA